MLAIASINDVFVYAYASTLVARRCSPGIPPKPGARILTCAKHFRTKRTFSFMACALWGEKFPPESRPGVNNGGINHEKTPTFYNQVPGKPSALFLKAIVAGFRGKVA